MTMTLAIRWLAEVKLDLTKFDIRLGRKEPKQVLLVDSPGFEDTAGPEVNLANGIGTIRALKKAEQVKVIVTFKEAHLDYRFKIIRSIANKRISFMYLMKNVSNQYYNVFVFF